MLEISALKTLYCIGTGLTEAEVPMETLDFVLNDFKVAFRHVRPNEDF